MSARKKQTAFNADGSVTFRSEHDGAPYAVQFHPVTLEVDWLEDVSFREVEHLEAVVPGETNESGCGGCNKKTFMKLVRGGWGWAKNALGVDVTPLSVLSYRDTLCANCPSNCNDHGICRDDWDDGRPDEAQGCGCVIPLKIRVNSESCPHKHW